MAAENFGRVMDVIFCHEGGYVDHPSDPGGATNMGITIGTLSAWRGERVTKQDVRDLTRAEAHDIYLDRYWDAVRGDELPPGLDLVAMDAAVHAGPVRAAKWLQAGLGVAVDGIIGPVTVAAAWDAGPEAIDAALDARLAFLRGLSTWATFGKGWQRRVADTRAAARDMFPAHPAPAGEGPPASPGLWGALWAMILDLFGSRT